MDGGTSESNEEDHNFDDDDDDDNDNANYEKKNIKTNKKQIKERNQ